MFSAKVWWVEEEKVGVTWDLSCAVPKPATIKKDSMDHNQALETCVPEKKQ